MTLTVIRNRRKLVRNERSPSGPSMWGGWPLTAQALTSAGLYLCDIHEGAVLLPADTLVYWT